MMATTNSAGRGSRGAPLASGGPAALGSSARRVGLCLAAVSLLLCDGPGFCEGESNLVQRAEQKYQEARKRFQNNTNDAEAAWQFGRACFDRAEFARNDEQREEIAKQGIAACRSLVGRDPKSAPGHYYLAMNLGQLARTKTLGALRIVEEM